MAKSPKARRLRTAPQTMRERAGKTGPATPRRQRLAFVAKPLRFAGKFKLWKAVAWLLRHLVPPYVRNSFRELRQVTWPTRGQTLRLTRDVILFSLVFGIIVGIFDWGLDTLFKEVVLR